MNARLTVKLRRQQPKIQLLGCGLDAIIQRPRDGGAEIVGLL